MDTVFREYEGSGRKETIRNFYYNNHTKQTVELVRNMQSKFSGLDGSRMPVWDAIMALNELVDDSDPDLGLPQSVHCFQTAEMIRKKYPDWEWLQVVGLVHDCGKILMHPGTYNLPDYLVVGDTFPVGCKWSDKIIYPEFFDDNPDSASEIYQKELGIYEKGTGFDNVLMSWGHDEYFYQVCIQNQCTLPPEALYIIRYHSFYAQHQYGAYDHLASDYDRKLMEHVRHFQQFDLYSKDEGAERLEISEETMEYYRALLDKYFPAVCVW